MKRIYYIVAETSPSDSINKSHKIFETPEYSDPEKSAIEYAKTLVQDRWSIVVYKYTVEHGVFPWGDQKQDSELIYETGNLSEDSADYPDWYEGKEWDM